MFVFLLTDIFFYIIIFSLGYYVYYVRKTKDILETWKHVFKSKTGIISIIVLAFFSLQCFFGSCEAEAFQGSEDKGAWASMGGS